MSEAMSQSPPPPIKSPRINHTTRGWKLFLLYDIFMMLIIIVNIFCLATNAFFMSPFAVWFFEILRLTEVLSFYRTDLNPWVIKTESWFITFLLIEFGCRWLIAILYKYHQRWFFFPFIHWYEVLAIIPMLRFLRLFRAGIIAYRLHELGYVVVPQSIQLRLKFYYSLVMEELSDRVVTTVIDGVSNELRTSSTHKQIIHDLVDHHRQLLAQTLAEILQETLAVELKHRQQDISDHIGQVISQAIEDTPELTQLLRRLPIVGGMIENQIQSIGQRLGKNISASLIQPFSAGSSNEPNAVYQLISEKISQINIENQQLEKLVESLVSESLTAIRKQTQVKQWQLSFEQQKVAKE